MDYFRIATELFTGYVALFFLTKILGKTQISQITAFDFISAIIVGELVGNALYDENVGIMDILITVLMWGFLIFLTDAEWLDEEPLLVQKNMKRVSKNRRYRGPSCFLKACVDVCRLLNSNRKPEIYKGILQMKR
jgi:uncharacterized membrane protein YcaP (DUF421 family)